MINSVQELKKNTVIILLFIFANLFITPTFARCEGAAGKGRYDGGWKLSDQYANIGVSKVEISGSEFTPKGTLLYDQQIMFSQLWAGLPKGENTTMIRCETAQDASSVFINIAGDSSYSLRNQIQTTPGYGETWPFSFPGQKPTSSVYRILGALPDGTWKIAKGYNDRFASTNRFPVAGYIYEPVDSADKYPYKIKVRDLPKIRLQTFRHDGNGPYRYGDGPGAYLGVTFWGYAGGQATSDVYFAYITIPKQQIISKESCAVNDVPRQVNLPEATIGELVNDDAQWQSFRINFRCESGALTNNILKVGLEPKGEVSSVDGRILLPNNTANAAKGVGIVYTAEEQSSARYWIKSSGCNNRDEVTNCPAAKEQGNAQGWYTLNGDDKRQGGVFNTNYKARLQKLSGSTAKDIKPGTVEATVNVMITIK